MASRYSGPRGTDGARPLGYWYAYSLVMYKNDSEATKELAAKIEEQGEDAIVERSDAEVVAMLVKAHDRKPAEANS